MDKINYVLQKSRAVSNKKFEKQEPQNTRWSNLSQDDYQKEERSPKNSFKRRNDNFDKRPYGKNTDRVRILCSFRCLHLGEWGQWGQCSKRCGSGRQIRELTLILDHTVYPLSLVQFS